jgi:GNAT superfamily N-acetyltransferase
MESMSPRFSFDLAEFDFPLVQSWLASTYWSPEIPLERVKRGFEASTLCVGAFLGTQQVGCARCLSDTTRFSYLADVFVDPAHRGQGIARSMVQQLLAHPLVSDTDMNLLLTRDAHDVYRPLGFAVFPGPDRVMFRKAKG